MASKKNIILFHGKSNLNIKKKINQHIEAIPLEERKMAVTEFSGLETDLALIIETSNSLPFGCSRQLLVIWDYEKVISPKLLANKLIPQIPAETTLFLISYTTLPSGDKNKLSKIANLEVIVEYFVDWKQVTHKIEGFLQENQLKANRETIDHLVKFFSNQPQSMDMELEKIALYFKPRNQITLDKLNGLLIDDQGQQNAYAVINAFFEKNLVMTLKNFKNYLSQFGEISLLVSLMIKEILLIVKFKEFKEEGIGTSKIFSQLGVMFDKQQKSLLSKNALFTLPEMMELLEKFLEIDKYLRLDNFFSQEAMKPRVPLKAKLNFEKLVCVTLN